MRLASSSILVRGDSGGETRAAGRPPMFPTRADLDAGVATLLAGRAAGEVLLGAAPTCAVIDLAVATRALADGHGAHGLGATLLHRSAPVASIVLDRALRAAVEADLSRLYHRLGGEPAAVDIGVEVAFQIVEGQFMALAAPTVRPPRRLARCSPPDDHDSSSAFDAFNVALGLRSARIALVLERLSTGLREFRPLSRELFALPRP
ncbi:MULTISPECIES: hypothetical protein [Methylosinus]|uniref:hypothetical protein n=1 Tax=Methylosinus TaxID=425 RepID=UPI0001D2F560|nr:MULTISPECIES: hypothetical protein [Methylosinus]OBS53641.1 hypothetical protein A8B73_04780 [Methylosinus sp. 3S-1]